MALRDADTALAAGKEDNIVIQHYTCGAWTQLNTPVDFRASTATAQVDSLRMFVLTIRDQGGTPKQVPRAAQAALPAEPLSPTLSPVISSPTADSAKATLTIANRGGALPSCHDTGTGTAGFSGDGGAATAAELNHPWGVDVDDSGNLFIADLSNHRVRKVTFFEPVVLESLTIAPATATIAAGLTQQFTATGNFSDSSPQDLTRSVTWSSNNEPFATIAAGDLATGVADGTATITATLAGINGSAALNVAQLATCGDDLTTHATLSAGLDCTGTTGTVFTIAADSVVFDGQGYKVLAPSAALMVSSKGNSGVSILNMDLSGTASNGLKISGGSGNLVSSVDVSYTGVTPAGYGVQLESSTNNVIQNVTATNRNPGVWLTGTSGGNTIQNNNFSGNNFAIHASQLGQGNSYLNNDLPNTTTCAIIVGATIRFRSRAATIRWPSTPYSSAGSTV